MSAKFIEFQLYKYPFLRHVYRKRRTGRYGFYRLESPQQKYERRKNSRLLRRKLLEQDVEAKNFFDWIWSLQKRFSYTNVEFANVLGVSLQTLKLWRNYHGHFPSQKSLQRLLELDHIATICVTKKIVYGITTSSTILK